MPFGKTALKDHGNMECFCATRPLKMDPPENGIQLGGSFHTKIYRVYRGILSEISRRFKIFTLDDER